MTKRTVPQQVEEFREKNPKAAKLMLEDMNEIAELGDRFNIIETAFYFGYMCGIKANKGSR